MTDSSAAPVVTVERGDVDQESAWGDAQLSVRVERPAVRITVYGSTAAVLGRSQRPTEADRLRAQSAGVDLRVRTSGGGAVLVGPWMLGVGVALPPDDPRAALPLGASYAWLGRAFVRWFSGLGIAAESAGAVMPADERAAWACFARTSWWEPQAEGRKIAGLAQVRRRNGVLYAAGVLLAEQPWALLCAALGKPNEDARVLALRTTSCEQVLGHPVDAHAASVSLGGVLADALCACR